MIIVHLIFDTSSLLACSLTCYSWYIASVPHLHHTLLTFPPLWPFHPELEWPRPVRNASKLGLLPFVKRYWIKSISISSPFSTKQFNRRILREHSGLVNVQKLEIDELDIPSFVPGVRQYFGNFLPTVRSLSLRKPRGSCRHIIFFVGLFQHLEDLTLLDGTLPFWKEEPMDDLTLIPPFAPPLQGRLVMASFRRVGFLKDMIALFGGIRFHYMDLFDVGEMELLLNACAETTKRLRLYSADPQGEQPYPKCM